MPWSSYISDHYYLHTFSLRVEEEKSFGMWGCTGNLDCAHCDCGYRIMALIATRLQF